MLGLKLNHGLSLMKITNQLLSELKIQIKVISPSGDQQQDGSAWLPWRQDMRVKMRNQQITFWVELIMSCDDRGSAHF